MLCGFSRGPETFATGERKCEEVNERLNLFTILAICTLNHVRL